MKKILSTAIITVLLSANFVVSASEAEDSYAVGESNIPIFFNNEKLEFKAPVINADDKIYVPLREFAKYLGMDVTWLQEGKVSIDEKGSEELLRFSIFPSSTYAETYLVKIYKNGKLEVVFGERACNDITSDKYMSDKISESRTIMLTEETIDEIQELTEKIAEDYRNENSTEAEDGWNVSLCIGQNVYSYEINSYDSESAAKLIGLIRKLTPITFSLHGWA
jgi:hypothetical protein